MVADITTLRPDQRAHAGIGWVPQERNIFKSLTVEENLTAVARPGRWTIEKVYGLFPRLAERRQNKDAVNTSAAIVDAVATGELTPTEAAELCKVVDSYARSLQTVELKERLSKLEKAVAK
jgi:ABC-type branched-subunit amino acid transport system ATPase component